MKLEFVPRYLIVHYNFLINLGIAMIIRTQFKSVIFSFFLSFLLISNITAKTSKLDNLPKLHYNICYSSSHPLDKQVLILTDFGPVIIVLNTVDAPNATSIFTQLIRNNYYKNTSFYRMYNDYFIQAGDHAESGIDNAGIKFPNEHQYNVNFIEGTVALANNNKDINSTGSQFFITFIRSPWLDGKYTVIGNVVSGLDILRSFFGKYETDHKGIMYNTIPIQIFMLDDYMKSHPEYKKHFIPTKFDKKSLLNELLGNTTNNNYNKSIDIFDSVDSLQLNPFIFSNFQ